MIIRCKHVHLNDFNDSMCVNNNSENCTEWVGDRCLTCDDFEIDFSILDKKDIEKVKNDAYKAIYSTHKKKDG